MTSRRGSRGPIAWRSARASGAPLAGDSIVLPLRDPSRQRAGARDPRAGCRYHRVARCPRPHRGRRTRRPRPQERRARAAPRRRASARPIRCGSRPWPFPAGTPDRAVLSAQVELAAARAARRATRCAIAREAWTTRRARRSGWSREYVLRIQTLTELRAEQRRDRRRCRAASTRSPPRARKLERQTEDLARSQPRDATRPGDNSDNLTFEQAKKAEAVAEAQQELLKQAEEARRAAAGAAEERGDGRRRRLGADGAAGRGAGSNSTRR